MTIQELYDLAKKQGIENYELKTNYRDYNQSWFPELYDVKKDWIKVSEDEKVVRI